MESSKNQMFVVKIGDNKYLSENKQLVDHINDAMQFVEEEDANDYASIWIAYNDVRSKDMQPDVISFEL